MPCNCTKIYKFKEPVNACDAQSFLSMFKNLPDGNYTVQLDFLNGVQKVPIAVASNVVTGTVALNESYTYVGKVIGTTLTFDSVEYDCFQFETKIYV